MEKPLKLLRKLREQKKLADTGAQAISAKEEPQEAISSPECVHMHKWTVADCHKCHYLVYWPNYPNLLGGGTRNFCGYEGLTKGSHKKVELFKLKECPNGQAMVKECHNTEPKSAVQPCHVCGSVRWWISIYDQKICAVCHPPASEKLVK